MTAPTMTIRPGVTIRPGITVQGFASPTVGSSFTISDADFSAADYLGPGLYDFSGSIGFGSDGANNLSYANYGIALTNLSTPKLAEILAYFAAKSLVIDGSFGYNFSVVGSGASSITKVVLGLTTSDFIIAPANSTDTNFPVDTSPLSSIVNANGILAFPVTFTLDSPLTPITHPGGWW